MQITEAILKEAEGGQSAVDLADKGSARATTSTALDTDQNIVSQTSHKHFAAQFRIYRNTHRPENSRVLVQVKGEMFEVAIAKK